MRERLRVAARQWALQTFAIAPASIKWYEVTDRALERVRNTTVKAILATLLEMILFNPLINTYYVCVMALAEGGPRAVASALDLAAIRTMCRDYVLFWGPVGLANYRLVPPQLRVAFTSLCGFVWQLRLAVGNTSPAAPLEDATLQEKEASDAARANS